MIQGEDVSNYRNIKKYWKPLLERKLKKKPLTDDKWPLYSQEKGTLLARAKPLPKYQGTIWIPRTEVEKQMLMRLILNYNLLLTPLLYPLQAP